MRLRGREGWLAAAALAGFVLAALAARAAPGQPGSVAVPARPSGSRPPKPSVPAPSEGPRRVPPSGSDHFRLPWTLIEWVLLAVLLLALAGIAVVLWPRWTRRLRSGRRLRATRPVEPAPDDLIRQVSATVRSTASQVTGGGQVRDAVILCWHRLEQTAEAAGLRRSPADTSSDLAGRLLASMPVSREPLDRLAALYREARFSSHPIPAESVAQARADLVQVRSELEAAAGAGRG